MTREGKQESAAVDPAWLRATVLRAGAVLSAAALDRDGLRVEHKGRVDLVTGTDLAIQELILGEISAAFPADRIVAEERDPTPDAGAVSVWYVDPLDGTTNFVHGHPFCAVSVARWTRGEPEIGVVYAPFLDELFLARKGGGSTLEHPSAGTGPRPLRCSSCTSLDDALLGTGFPYHRGATARLNLAICAHALTRVRGLRRAGSAALDLCHVGLGRLDGYWEMGLHPWDVAAASLIAREAGAIVTDFTGSPGILDRGRVAAAAPGLHAELLGLIETGHRQPDLDALGPLPALPLSLTGPLPTELV